MVRELFGAQPDAWQEDALEAFPHCPRLAMQSCAGPGKTALLAWIGWNFLLTRPHPMIGCTSVTGDNLKANLWAELGRWYNKSPLLKATFDVTKQYIAAKDHPNTWRMEARSWAKDADAQAVGNALRGLHADYIMWLLDETGDYPASVLPVVENIFAGQPKEAHIVQAGNPSKLDGPLYRAAVMARHLWHVIEITADPDDPKRTPRVSVEHARQQIEQYGRDNPWVMINILGKFPPSSLNALIGPDEVRAAMQRYYREYEIGDAARVLGVDVARYGDDASSICRRQGVQMLPFLTYRNLDSTQGAAQVVHAWRDWDANACFIDETGGFGSGWSDQLRVLGKTPVGVQFAGEAQDKARYYNKRAEMAFALVEWIKRGGALPSNADRLLTALTQTEYAFRGDRILLEPKEDVKKKIGFSPDEMDSAMLTFAHPVEPRRKVLGHGNANRSAVSGDWNPYASMGSATRY